MNLKYVLLGLLANKPGSGYSLHKRFFPHLRPILSQIYRTLAQMAEKDLVTCERLEQDKLPDQKVYHITEAGLDMLDNWLKSPIMPRVRLDPMLSQAWFSARIGKKSFASNLREYAKGARRQIEWASDARKKIELGAQSSGNADDAFYRNAVIDCGVAQMMAWLNWAEDIIKQLSTSDSIPAERLPSSSRSRRKKAKTQE